MGRTADGAVDTISETTRNSAVAPTHGMGSQGGQRGSLCTRSLVSRCPSNHGQSLSPSTDGTRFNVQDIHCVKIWCSINTPRTTRHAPTDRRSQFPTPRRIPFHVPSRRHIPSHSVHTQIAPWIRRWHAIMAVHGAIIQKTKSVGTPFAAG